jgi:hypothetical protein
MRDLVVLILHLLATVARLAGPGGARERQFPPDSYVTGPRFQLRPRSSSGGLRPNHQVNVTVEHLPQGQDPIDRLAVVRLVEKAIQLRRRRPWPAHDLALR